jgi:hypothetical protein
MENVLDRLGFLSATRCDISTEIESVASRFCDFLCHPEAFKSLPFSMIYEILSQGSLKLESDDSLYNFISKGSETKREMFKVLEFVRLEYSSMEVMNDFFDVLSEPSYKISASMWSSLRSRLTRPNINCRQFPPSVKKVTITGARGHGQITIDVPDGIIGHLTREYGGNVHDGHVVDVTSESFKKETIGANPRSGALRTTASMLLRIQLIWKPIHVSVQPIAWEIFSTPGTIGCAAIAPDGPQQRRWQLRCSPDFDITGAMTLHSLLPRVQLSRVKQPLCLEPIGSFKIAVPRVIAMRQFCLIRGGSNHHISIVPQQVSAPSS